jgi:hypothetical protein
MHPKASSPRLKPQAKMTFETCTFKIDSTTLTKLKAYCELIHSEQSYIIREALNYLFESDTTFQEFFKSRSKAEPEHFGPEVARTNDTPNATS